MLIKWNQECLKVVDTGSAVKTLLPGVNEISEKDWRIMKPSLSLEIEHGQITVMEEMTRKSGDSAPVIAKSLDELTPKKAVELVKLTNSGETLNIWLAKETRADIRRRIEDRLAELGIEKDDSIVIDEDDGDEDENAGNDDNNPEGVKKTKKAKAKAE
jgi:hypothetical protein